GRADLHSFPTRRSSDRGRWSNGVSERSRSARLQVVRADRPREQEEGQRFLIIAAASRAIARATSLAEALPSIRSYNLQSRAAGRSEEHTSELQSREKLV